MINSRKVIGIIGGMGPMATADLFIKITEKTEASCDQEHIRIIIDSNTDIPDRTESIFAGNDAPALEMTDSARRLVAAGADIILIPCHTAHYYYDAVAESCPVPVLNMPEETAKAVKRMGVRCAGLLATSGTAGSGVYDRIFEKYGICLVKPDGVAQDRLMSMIYNEIKAGIPVRTGFLTAVLDSMEAQGCELFVLGCTELPLVREAFMGRRFLDPTAVLAEAAILAAGGKIKSHDK